MALGFHELIAMIDGCGRVWRPWSENNGRAAVVLRLGVSVDWSSDCEKGKQTRSRLASLKIGDPHAGHSIINSHRGKAELRVDLSSVSSAKTVPSAKRFPSSFV